jgi:hypothetical protein
MFSVLPRQAFDPMQEPFPIRPLFPEQAPSPKQEPAFTSPAFD